MVRFYLATSSDSSLSGERQDKLDFPGLEALRGAGSGDRALCPARPDAVARALRGLLGGAAGSRDRRDDARQPARPGGGAPPRARRARELRGAHRKRLHPALPRAQARDGSLPFPAGADDGGRRDESGGQEQGSPVLPLRGTAHPRRVEPHPRARERSGQRPAAGGGDPDLRQSMEQLERSQQRDNVKLGDLDLLRRQVGELAPRLAARRERRAAKGGLRRVRRRRARGPCRDRSTWDRLQLAGHGPRASAGDHRGARVDRREGRPEDRGAVARHLSPAARTARGRRPTAASS